MKLTIDRNIWLRGDPGHSKLHRQKDGKMCCVGIYLHQCGIPLEKLTEKSTADDVEDERVPGWLLKTFENGLLKQVESSPEAFDLYKENDRAGDDYWSQEGKRVPVLHPTVHPEQESEREVIVSDMFQKQGVEVEFIN